MKRTEPYPIAVRSLRERWREGDRWLNAATWPLFMIVALLVAKSWFDIPPIPSGTIGLLGAIVASTLLRASSRMPLPEARDRDVVADWLVGHGYRQESRGWVPDLPWFLQRRSQVVRVTGGGVTGPRHVLKMMQRRLMTSGSGGT